MQFYSTKYISPKVDLQEAVLRSMPSDKGLYMPETIGSLPKGFFEAEVVEQLSFPELSFQMARCLLKGTIPEEDLKEIVYRAINFDAPLVTLDDNCSCLELFHGPSLAFKDFGARFMAELMSYYVQNSRDGELYILVATSGDTGGAVAQGFLNAKGINVIILYPSKKISELQEKQLTTLGANITALEVHGTFDDCQRLVKTAFLDADLRQKMNLSSANSINIARLIPQSFYYARAYQQLKNKDRKAVMCVPSGNFGNLTAGLLAQKIGLPVHQFIAANNANDVFTEYHQKGIFTPRPSVKTPSNAMDVGNPSNLQRIQDLYNNDVDAIRKAITAYSYSNEETLEAIKEVYEKYNYLACPHTAVAYLGVKAYQEAYGTEAHGIFLGTAHPAKFLDIVEPVLNQKVAIPENLAKLTNRTKVAVQMSTEFEDLKKYLLGV